MHDLHNYQSLTAVLHGLKLANFDAPRLSNQWPLINDSQNYAFYREALATTGGLPFLYPHVKEAHDEPHRGEVLLELFRPKTFLVGQEDIAPIESHFETYGYNKKNSTKFWEWMKLIFCR